MKRRLLFVLMIFCCATLALAMGSKQARESKKHASDTTAVKQGIQGKVEIWEGNFMPMAEPGKSGGTISPAAGRRVRAYEPVKNLGGLATAQCDSVATTMVAETVTDSTGRFFLPVSPGTYSVFVEEKNGWYANGWNSDGVQGAVKVESGKVSDTTIKITTKATF